jgi:hypothetical protein
MAAENKCVRSNDGYDFCMGATVFEESVTDVLRIGGVRSVTIYDTLPLEGLLLFCGIEPGAHFLLSL